MILWREEQKVKTLYRTEKGRTESHNPLWNRKGKNRVKGRTESYDPMWNWKGKNRKAMTLYKAHVPIWNREGKNSRTEKQKNRNPIPYVSNESVKGRTETGNPCTHIPMWKHWNYEGKNRNPWPYITDDSMKGKNRNPIPMYPYVYVSMKGRTETQDPILAMNLRKGRTEIQNPCALKKEKKKTHRPKYK